MLGLGNTLVGGAPTSEFTPADLGGLLLWWRYNTGLQESDTSFPEDGEGVTQWTDQSGNGLHGTKTSGLSNYSSTHKAPYFDGSTDSLNISQQTLVAFSVYVRIRFEASGAAINSSDVLVEDDDTGNNFWRIQNTTTTRIKIGGSSATNFTFHTELAEDTWYNLGLERDGDDVVTSYLDGAINGSGVELATPLRNWAVDNLKGGDGCYISEVVIVEDGLSAGQRALLNTWLENETEG